MTKLLVIEDNKPLAKSLRGWLSRQYDITVAFSGHAGISHLAKERFEVIILDLGLPDLPGQEVCSQIRASGIKTPILVLTGSDDVNAKVAMLDIGADDYLLKPFYIGELQARLRALRRRSAVAKARPSDILTVADLRLDAARRTVERQGKVITLRRKEFDILEYLMINSGMVVTRAMIISTIWDSQIERWNNTVDVHVKYLRDKVDRPFAHKLIKTAYGVGYMIDDK
jgi:DNA-binding response OmpR family regulator